MRPRSLGVKVKHHWRRNVALELLGDTTVPCYQTKVEANSGKAWFIPFRYVGLGFLSLIKHQGPDENQKMLLSLPKTVSNNRKLAFLLWSNKQEFDKVLDEIAVENFDGTHLVIHMENVRVLDFQGAKRVSYADFASARDWCTVCMRISGGEQGKIKKPLVTHVWITEWNWWSEL